MRRERRALTGLVACVASTGVAGLVATLLLAATASAQQPPTVPRTGGIPACEAELAACEAAAWQFPGDGWTGTPLAYEDCGDGTIVDLNTGLMWEQKVPGGDETTCLTALHAVDSLCTRREAGTLADTLADWIDAVNTEPYAGHSDWRIPNVKELQSIVDYFVALPSIQRPAFDPTASGLYWSATPLNQDVEFGGWLVDFAFGGVVVGAGDFHVRAVRNGSCP